MPSHGPRTVNGLFDFVGYFELTLSLVITIKFIFNIESISIVSHIVRGDVST